MNQVKYAVELKGESDLLMHYDNIKAGERVRAWSKDPGNKSKSVAGDDRTPAWTWIGYLMHDSKNVCISSDNLMSMLRDGGKKCPAAAGRGSLKAQTQSGIIVNEAGWAVKVGGKNIPIDPILEYLVEEDFEKHVKMAEKLGIDLFVKRAKIGTSKHVRVRPRFENWSAAGTITVFDGQLTETVMRRLLETAGFYVGLCDWRPGAPQAPGQFGRFSATIKAI